MFSDDKIINNGEPRETRALLETFNREKAEKEIKSAFTRMEVLAKASEVFVQAKLDLNVLLPSICEQVIPQFGHAASLHLLSQQGDTLDVAAFKHMDPEAERMLREMAYAEPIRLEDSLTGRVVQSGKPVLLSGEFPEDFKSRVNHRYRSILDRFPIGSLMVVPLRSAGKIIGAMTAARLKGVPPFTLDDQITLQHLADRAGSAIDRARLHQALQKEEERFRLAAEAVNSVIYDRDIPTGQTERSCGLYNLLGFHPHEVSSTVDWWISRIHPEDYFRVSALMEKAVENASSYDAEYRVQHKNGAHIHVWDKGLIVRNKDGQAVRIVGSILDISERKKFEEDLVNQAKELEQFAYVSSHDLQEPLRKVATYAQLLEKKYGSQLGEEGARYIKSITGGALRMHTLIRDLLNYSRLNKQEGKRETVNLGDVAAQVVSDLETVIREKQAAVVVEALPHVSGNRLRLHQLIQNLVSNAIKFHGAEAPRVRLWAQPRGGSEWVIAVEDNGIGIEPQYTEQIFKVFHRLHGQGQYEGTGIGLAICKKIVDQHHGRIWLESTPGKGTTFFVSLPAGPP